VAVASAAPLPPFRSSLLCNDRYVPQLQARLGAAEACERRIGGRIVALERSVVHLLGHQQEIQAFYRLCDCCVLPTRFVGESYPLTIIEALLAGIPVIATDVGEIRSILEIDREPMGIIVPPNEDDAMFDESVTQAMRHLLDEQVYQDLRASVMRNRVKYSMDSLVERYIAIYQQVLASAPIPAKPVPLGGKNECQQASITGSCGGVASLGACW